MATLSELERFALDLPENQRAVLAAQLLQSLSGVLHEDDDGLQQAMNRDRELDLNPSLGLSLEQLDRQIQARRQGA